MMLRFYKAGSDSTHKYVAKVDDVRLDREDEDLPVLEIQAGRFRAVIAPTSPTDEMFRTLHRTVVRLEAQLAALEPGEGEE